MSKKLTKKTAFTLAEVLLTLVIVGIVAALTIPTILSATNKQEYVVGLKKTYLTLDSGLKELMTKKGCSTFSCVVGHLDAGDYANSTNEVMDLLSETVVMTNKCYANEKIGECWHVGNNWKTLNGNNNFSTDGRARFETSSFMVAIYLNNSGCTDTNAKFNSKNSGCGVFNREC